MEIDKALKVMTKVWGRPKWGPDEEYWVFLATIRGDAKDKKERISSWSEQGFRWPQDKLKIRAYIVQNLTNELYWCPNLFELNRRHKAMVWDERCLYADLDAVDPKKIKDYPPTIAWESSPGRYQGIWMFSSAALTGASDDGGENQRLSYYLGADIGGWDTTQMLRVPGSDNFKPDYRKANNGKPLPGKILWDNGRQWLPDEFDSLPEVQSGGGIELDVLEDEVDRIDRHAVWGRVRLKVSSRVREFISQREAHGDRSEILWEIERELADAGCSIAEIVAILRPSVWNKYEGRNDELRRLTTEAAKAVSQRTEATKDNDSALEEVDDDIVRPKPSNLFTLLASIKQPRWLIRGVLTEGAVGFIAGQPKQYKSWFALDMALSVASGQPFLGHFDIEQRGPVLYLQEEDSPPLVKQRIGKVGIGKSADRVTKEGDDIVWLPGEGGNMTDLDIDAAIMSGFLLSDPAWQSWLDEVMSEKPGGYRLVILDPLMMMAGDVEENRAQEMTTKIFKPLKELARKHACAAQLVHHMKKGDPRNPQRGGQMMLGSVANHAWAEDSMYLKYGKGGAIVVEQESKNAPVPGFTVSGIRNRRWDPRVSVSHITDDAPTDDAQGSIRNAPRMKQGRSDRDTHRSKPTTTRTPNKTTSAALKALADAGSSTVAKLSKVTGLHAQSIYEAFKRHEAKGWITKEGSTFSITPDGREAVK